MSDRKLWNEMTAKEKAAWFDNSYNSFKRMEEEERLKRIRTRSARWKGLKRHAKRRWWQF